MGQISFLTEYSHIVYQIKSIDETITLENVLSKSDDYVIQDGRQKVIMFKCRALDKVFAIGYFYSMIFFSIGYFNYQLGTLTIVTPLFKIE